jgi:acylphosphatase
VEVTESNTAERREVHFAGHVQGVGFRCAAQQIAQRFAVTGYVQNLSDGRVRLLGEGLPHELDALLNAVNTRMSCWIDGTQVARSPATGEFSDFRVRH